MVFIVSNRMMAIYEMQLGAYPTPINISYAWSFGSLTGIAMFMQVISGLVLGTVYVPHPDLVMEILESFARDAQYGWLMRDMHANSPSLIFLWMYCHQARGLLMGSRPVYAWVTGWFLLVLTIVTSFLGYTLVWGQMSYWAATVITCLVTVLPYGQDLLAMIWGGPVIGPATLSRFFCAHYTLALVVMSLVVIHLLAVHLTGSSHPLHTQAVEKVPFMQYYVLKDAVGFAVASIFSFLLILALPVITMDTELYINVNTMSTPEHIVPEWYLLPFYAILRCIPNKVGGCLLVVMILVLHLLACVKEPVELPFPEEKD